MRAAVISMGSISSKMVAEAMKKYFEEVDQLDIKEFDVNLGKEEEILYAGKPIAQYDCIYLKGSGRYANLLRSIANILGKKTFIPIKPAAFTTGHDKLLTHIALQKAKIPQPNTYVVATSQAAKKVIKKMHTPIVIKLPTGTHGKGVMLADSYESASSMIDALAVLKQPFLLQEYIETDGKDTRALIVGNEIVASMKRTAETGEKRSNLHTGGKGESTVLSAQSKKIALNAARAIGAEICGVDMLESVRGTRVIEVNISPGLQGINKTTDVNIPDVIAKYLFERTKACKDGKCNQKVVQEIIGQQEVKEIITAVDFRGERVLLPSIASKIAKLSEDDEIILKLSKGRIEIEKIKKKETESKDEEE